MSSEIFRTGLRLATFSVASSVSLATTSFLLRNPLSRGIVGLTLLFGVLVSILYVCSKYLKVLWIASDRFAAFIVSIVLKPVRPSSQPLEKVQ